MTTSPVVQSDLDFGDGFDFTDPGLLARGLPVEQFACLRRSSPVWWNAQDPDRGGGFRDGGYWVISKHAHIREISRDPETWSSHLNGCVMRYANDIPAEQLETAKIPHAKSGPAGAHAAAQADLAALHASQRSQARGWANPGRPRDRHRR